MWVHALYIYNHIFAEITKKFDLKVLWLTFPMSKKLRIWPSHTSRCKCADQSKNDVKFRADAKNRPKFRDLFLLQIPWHKRSVEKCETVQRCMGK